MLLAKLAGCNMIKCSMHMISIVGSVSKKDTSFDVLQNSNVHLPQTCSFSSVASGSVLGLLILALGSLEFETF